MGVSKYVTKKSVTEKQKPEVSGVAKYMAKVKSVMDSAATKIEKTLEGEFIPAGQNLR